MAVGKATLVDAGEVHPHIPGSLLHDLIVVASGLLPKFLREIDVFPDGLAGFGGHAIELVGHGAQLGRPPVDVSEGLLDELAHPDQGKALDPALALRDDALAQPFDELLESDRQETDGGPIAEDRSEEHTSELQ